MSDNMIKVLPPDVADKIAAGEVAERPSAVVKELVENAIDAGADKITVEIKNGGIKLIRVADNGSGIPPEQVSTAFLRHATSKLRSADDLFSISTMGFRGEALASICAVAKVDVITKTAKSDVGVHYEVDHGVCGEPDEVACADGTIMVVEDLFANVPARMKFLKRDSTEAGYVSDLLTRLALSRPDIAFDYISDGKQIFNTSGDGDIVNVILKVYGLNFAKAVEKVDYTEDGVRISGVIGKPELTFGNRTKQTLFVNGRYIKNHVVSKIVGEAFRNSIMVGKFPFFVLAIELPPELVDVNVHPAKTEVKFANEKALYDIIYHAVKNALFGGEPYKKPEQQKMEISEDRPSDFGFSRSNGNANNVYKKQFPPKNSGGGSNLNDASAGLTPKIINNYLNYTKPMAETDTDTIKDEIAESRELSQPVQHEDIQMNFGKNGAEEEVGAEQGGVIFSDYRIIGQLFDTYVLVCEGKSLFMIDQHAAHERMRFENLKKSYFAGERMSQMMLTPVVVNLSHIEYDAVMSNLDEFKKFGFAVEEFGTNTVIVNETPIIADDAAIRDLLIELADAFADNIRRPIADFEEKALDMISCKYAVKANDRLSMSEMAETVREVSELYSKGIKTCPHGRPIVAEITKYEIEKMFKRVV